MKPFYMSSRGGVCDIVFAGSKAEAKRFFHGCHCENGRVRRELKFRAIRFRANDKPARVNLGPLGLEIWQHGRRAALLTGPVSLRRTWQWIEASGVIQGAASDQLEVRRSIGIPPTSVAEMKEG